MKAMRSIRYVPDLFLVTQSHAAAIFLSQLLYWFSPANHGGSRLRIKHEDKLWLAKSAEEWWQECKLTKRNLRTIEAKLVRLGLIEIRVWKFNGFPTRHYHLNLDVLSCRIDTMESVETTLSKESVETTLSITSITTKTTDNDFKTTEAGASGHGSAGVDMEVKDVGQKTAKEVMEEIQQAKKISPTKPERITAKGLSAYWRQVVPLNFETGFHKPHTMKELGVLSRYVKTTGEYAFPAMNWALKNWQKFSDKARDELGMEIPSTPTVYALLKGCKAAVEGYLKSQEKPAPVVFDQPVQMNAQQKAPEDSPATKEQVEAMLKSIKE